MKNTTSAPKSPSKTPIDVLRSLEAALRHVQEVKLALELIDPVAFGDHSVLHTQSLDSTSQLCNSISNLLAVRPLKKTEIVKVQPKVVEPVAPVEPVQVAEEGPVDSLPLIKSAAGRTRRSKKAAELAPEVVAAE